MAERPKGGGTNRAWKSKPGRSAGAGNAVLRAGQPSHGKVADSVKLPVTPARRVAFDILLAVERQRGHSDELLRSAAMAQMSRVDRNLATTLVMGTLRWQIALDAGLMPLLHRPSERPPAEVLLVLRLGAFQLVHLQRVPVHAAVNESVELCRAAGQPQAAAMVNAVLRRVAAQQREGTAAAKVPIFESTASFAQRLGHPAWLAERWVAAYGRAAALRICEAGQHEPRRGGLFAAPAMKPSALEEGPAEEKGTSAGNAVLPSEAEGAAWDPEDAAIIPRPEESAGAPVMDDGSRLVAELAAIAMPTARHVWDCCAAPGGKAMVLLDRLPDAAILATDVSERRLAAMRVRLGKVGQPAVNVLTVAVAAEALPAAEGSFDLVLCDVPCSGTGTLARNPEIRHRLGPEDLARQAERQRSILAAALARVAAGGRLVYATCSLEAEECEAIVDAVAGGWTRVPLRPLIEALTRAGPLGENATPAAMVRNDALRTLPGVHPCDGFFAVVLERRSS